MAKTDPPTESEPGQALHVSAQDARGGEIILRTRARRLIFIAGLIGIVILAILLALHGSH